MKRIVPYALLGLAACVLLQVAATGENPVERPWKYDSTNIFVIHLETGDTFGWASGETTGVGRFENIHVGWYDLQTREWWGEGTVTTANGDQRFWEGYSSPTTGGTLVTMTGGTGRFENSTGEMLVVRTSELEQKIVGPFMLRRYESAGSGWVKY